jgi:hypothetical protein
MPNNLDTLQNNVNFISSSFSLTSLVFNLFFGALIAILIKIHYKKYSSTLNNREEFTNIFPFILLTTVLVISIVKSSLALSLGLVGALSIVRFRTPIKEPEELSYLFICIAAGLGLGANQTMPTIVSVIFILFIMILIKSKKTKNEDKNMFLSIEIDTSLNQKKENLLEEINNKLSKEVTHYDLKRLEYRKNLIDLTYQLNIDDINKLEKIIKQIELINPNISITYIDQNQVPSI